MPVLLGVQVAQVARDAGLHGDPLVVAVAVAGAESSWNSEAVNPSSGARGLWQILPSAHPQYDLASLLNPVYNAQAMYAVSGGGTNWQPWEAYTNGAWKDWKDEAVAAVTALGDTGYAPPGGLGALLPVPQPVYTPPPTASLIPALTLYAPSQIRIDGESTTALADVLEATLSLDSQDASRLVVRVTDQRRDLLRSKLTTTRSRVSLDGILFELANITKSRDQLQLTFIDAAAAEYIRIVGEVFTQAMGAGTRGDFVRSIAARVPWVPVDVESGGINLEELRTEPDESLWAGLRRVAEDVGWSRLVVANRLLVGSDEWLASRTAPVVVREFEQGIGHIDFDLRIGAKVDRATFEVDSGLWWVPPTQAVTVEGCGAADGAWIVGKVDRRTDRTRSSVTLARPALPLPEPTGTLGPSTPVPTPTGATAPAEVGTGPWKGSQSVVEWLTSSYTGLGLTVTSRKRSTRDTASGNVSDHWEGNLNAYAMDISNGVTTPEEDKLAVDVMAKLGVTYNGKTELHHRGEHTYASQVFRVEVIYRSNDGGDHFDHVHTGAETRPDDD